MFALDVGNEITPQTIYVTIEAGQDGIPVTKSMGGSSVRRRLFGSPTPQPSPNRRIRTTTTTVPLRGLTDDEAEATPRPGRRYSSGRPGTPAATSTKKQTSAKKPTSARKPRAPRRKTATPKAIRQPRGTPILSSDDLQSETPAIVEQSIPKRKPGRPPKRKSIDVPSGQSDPNLIQSLPRKRGGGKRHSLVPDEVAPVSAGTNEDTELPADLDGPSRSPEALTDPQEDPAVDDDGGIGVQEEDERDIWMANMPDDFPPGRQQPIRDAAPGIDFSEPIEASSTSHHPSMLENQEPLPGESGDYGPMMDYDDRSDVVSHHPEEQVDVSHRPDELEDQMPLPSESNEYGPIMDYDDRSDVISHHSEEKVEVMHRPDELEDQRSLPGESNNHGPMMGYGDRNDLVSRHFGGQTEVGRYPDELEDQGALPGESDDYAPMMEQDDMSVAESYHSERPSRGGEEPNHTVDFESFTMIGLDAMKSFRRSQNSPDSELPEIGETTSFLINKTLDSVRQEFAESEEDEVDILVSRDQTPADTGLKRQDRISSSPGIQGQPTQSSAKEPLLDISPSPGRTESWTGSVVGDGPRQVVQSTADVVESSGPADLGSEVIEPMQDDEDSFSDIPEEVLAAAESQEETQSPTPHTFKRLDIPLPAVKLNNAESSFGRLFHPLVGQMNGRPESSHPTPSESTRPGTGDNYDAPPRFAPRSIQSRGAPEQAIQRSSPPHSVRSGSDSNRLLTPDETTSSNTQSPAAEPIALIENPRPITSDDIGSSPPEMSTFEQDERPTLPSRRNSDTPANRQPMIHVQRVQERQVFAAGLQSFQPGVQRPALSPVVRIGRTLQNILSDPPSPSARSSALGSPFRGSVRNSSPLDGVAIDEALQNIPSADELSQNQAIQAAPQPPPPIAQSSAKSWAMSFAPLSQIKNLVSHGAQLFTSPNVNVSQALDDPFGPSSPTLEKRPDDTRNSAFLDRIKQASREGSAYSSRIDKRANASNDNETSQARDQTITTYNSSTAPVKPLHSRLVGLEGFHSRLQNAGIMVGFDGAHDDGSDEVVGDQSPEEPRVNVAQLINDQPEAGESLEMDIGQGQHKSGDRSDQDTHLAGEDEMQLDEAPISDDESEEEDIWVVEANKSPLSPKGPVPHDEIINNTFRKSGLSIDWGVRSTNSLRNSRSQGASALDLDRSIYENPPESLEDYSLLDLHSGTPTEPSAKKPTPEAQKQPKKVDLSDFFSSSPNFMERQRRAKAASLAKPLAQKPAAKPNHAASLEINLEILPDPRLSADRMIDGPPSPAPGVSQYTSQVSTTRTSSTPTPERITYARVPQQEFTPRHGGNDATLFKNWPVHSSQPAVARPASSDSHCNAQPSTPQAHEGSSFNTPDLRPLPARAASPSKSCLRSPLKPKTPGRVVEFTSSTISAVVPFQALTVPEKEAPTTRASNSLLPGPSFPHKEIGAATLSANNPSPQHKRLHDIQQEQRRQQGPGSPLSQTRWSRKHWIFLDELLQSYRQNPLEFQLRYGGGVISSPRKLSSSSELLGKQVTSQGESLVLEQWHLDVVDAFKKEVGGWPENMLAKRFFALIVGEKRRNLGLVPKRR